MVICMATKRDRETLRIGYKRGAFINQLLVRQTVLPHIPCPHDIVSIELRAAGTVESVEHGELEFQELRVLIRPKEAA